MLLTPYGGERLREPPGLLLLDRRRLGGDLDRRRKGGGDLDRLQLRLRLLLRRPLRLAGGDRGDRLRRAGEPRSSSGSLSFPGLGILTSTILCPSTFLLMDNVWFQGETFFESNKTALRFLTVLW